MRTRNAWRKNDPRSSVVIAELLGSEGYTEFTHNQVKKYWHNRVMNDREGRIARTERAFHETVAPHLTDAQRLVLGKYISVIARMNLDTGLRIGMNIEHRERTTNEVALAQLNQAGGGE